MISGRQANEGSNVVKGVMIVDNDDAGVRGRQQNKSSNSDDDSGVTGR